MDDARPGGAGPLSGRLVIDLSRALAGPHAAMMLADMGALRQPEQGVPARA